MPILILVSSAEVEFIYLDEFFPQNLVFLFSLTQQYLQVVDINLVLLFKLRIAERLHHYRSWLKVIYNCILKFSNS